MNCDVYFEKKKKKFYEEVRYPSALVYRTIQVVCDVLLLIQDRTHCLISTYNTVFECSYTCIGFVIFNELSNV